MESSLFGFDMYLNIDLVKSYMIDCGFCSVVVRRSTQETMWPCHDLESRVRARHSRILILPVGMVGVASSPTDT